MSHLISSLANWLRVVSVFIQWNDKTKQKHDFHRCHLVWSLPYAVVLVCYILQSSTTFFFSFFCQLTTFYKQKVTINSLYISFYAEYNMQMWGLTNTNCSIANLNTDTPQFNDIWYISVFLVSRKDIFCWSRVIDNCSFLGLSIDF